MEKSYAVILLGAAGAALLPSGATAQAPVVTSFAPGRNALSANPTGDVELTFSQLVTGASNIRVFGSRRTGLLTGTVRGDGTTRLGFRTSQSFGLGETVSVTVPASVHGTGAGSPAVAGTVYQFRTVVGGGQFTQYYVGTSSLPEVGTALHEPTLADVNNDGQLDLLLADEQNDRVRLRLGGNNFFGPATLLNTGQQPGSIAVADMNNDGKLDLLTSSNSGMARMVSVAMGDGLGGFGTPVSVPVAATPGRVQVGDVNADGNLDFVVPVLVPVTTPAGPASTVLAVHLGNGRGGFSAAPDVPLDLSTSSPNLHLADFNNDGQLDCLVGSTTTNLLKTYLGNGQGGFVLSTTAPVVRTGSTDVADLTGDGLLDVVMADGPSNAVRVYPGTGQGGFGVATVLPVASPTSVMVSSVPGGIGLFATYHTATSSGTAAWTKYPYTSGFGSPHLMSNCAGTSLVMGSVYGGFPLLVIVDNGVNGGSPNVKARLNQVVLATRPSANALPLTCYPNPAHGTVQLALPTGTASAWRVEVYNGLGQRVSQQAMAAVPMGSSATLDVSHLPAGLYTVRATTADQRTGSLPLTIE